MATSKVERLVNLVIALLSTRGYITAEKIRSSVAGYSDSPSVEAFSRMFERDKNELRDLGIPLEVGRVSALDPTEGYRINRDAYSLPPVELTPDEAAAVAVAIQLWESPELITATQGALLKLRAAGVDAEETPQPGIEPRLAGEAAFGPLWEAVRDRRPVTFAYRAVGRSEPQQRRLEPWGVVNRHGRWYVAGHDRDRDAVRVFRLSRIEGPVRFTGPSGSVTVPEGTDVRETVRAWDTQPPVQRTALLRVRNGAGHGIRRYATSVRPDGEGWDLVEAPFSDVLWYAEHLASFGRAVIAVEPADLREAVITQLKGAMA